MKSNLAKGITFALEQKAEVVTGFYSEDDVIILIEALLAKAGLKRNEHGHIDQRSKILAPKRTILESRDVMEMESEVNDLVLEISNIAPSQQILIPVIIPSCVHWVTLQIRSYKDSKICLRCYDSAGHSYKEMDILRDLLINKLKSKHILLSQAITPKIQNIREGDVYCGGYTARLIANLAISERPDYAEISIWNCGGLHNEALRIEDCKIVNKVLPFNYQKFGQRDKPIDYERKAQTAREMNSALQSSRDSIEGKIKILSTDERTELKEKLERVRQQQLNVPDRDVKHVCKILRESGLDNTILKPFIFQFDNEKKEYIRTDAKGKRVSVDEDGDYDIRDDLEIEQIQEMLRCTLEHLERQDDTAKTHSSVKTLNNCDQGLEKIDEEQAINRQRYIQKDDFQSEFREFIEIDESIKEEFAKSQKESNERKEKLRVTSEKEKIADLTRTKEELDKEIAVLFSQIQKLETIIKQGEELLLNSNDNIDTEAKYQKFLSGDTQRAEKEAQEKRNEVLRQVRLRNNAEENKRHINEEIKKIEELMNQHEVGVQRTNDQKKALETKNSTTSKIIESIEHSLHMLNLEIKDLEEKIKSKQEEKKKQESLRDEIDAINLDKEYSKLIVILEKETKESLLSVKLRINENESYVKQTQKSAEETKKQYFDLKNEREKKEKLIQEGQDTEKALLQTIKECDAKIAHYTRRIDHYEAHNWGIFGRWWCSESYCCSENYEIWLTNLKAERNQKSTHQGKLKDIQAELKQNKDRKKILDVEEPKKHTEYTDLAAQLTEQSLSDKRENDFIKELRRIRNQFLRVKTQAITVLDKDLKENEAKIASKKRELYGKKAEKIEQDKILQNNNEEISKYELEISMFRQKIEQCKVEIAKKRQELDKIIGRPREDSNDPIDLPQPTAKTENSELENIRRTLEEKKSLKIAREEELTTLKAEREKIQNRINIASSSATELMMLEAMQREDFLLADSKRRMTFLLEVNIKSFNFHIDGIGRLSESKLDNLIKTLLSIARNTYQKFSLLNPAIVDSKERALLLTHIEKIKESSGKNEPQDITQLLVNIISNAIYESGHGKNVAGTVFLLGNINYVREKLLLYEYMGDYLILRQEIRMDKMDMIHQVIIHLLNRELLDVLCCIKYRKESKKQLKDTAVETLYNIYKQEKFLLLGKTVTDQFMDFVKDTASTTLEERIVKREVAVLQEIYKSFEEYTQESNNVRERIIYLKEVYIERMESIIHDECDRRKTNLTEDNNQGDIRAEKLKKMEEEIKDLEQKIQKKDKELKDKEKEVEQKEIKIETLKNSHKEQEKDISKKIEELTYELEEKKKILAESEAGVKSDKAQNTKLAQEIQGKEKQLSEMKLHKESLRKQMQEKEDELAIMRQKRIIIEAKKAEYETKKAQREREKEILKTENIGLTLWIKFINDVYQEFKENRELFIHRRTIKAKMDTTDELGEKYKLLLADVLTEDGQLKYENVLKRFGSKEVQAEARKNDAIRREGLEKGLYKILSVPSITHGLSANGALCVEAVGINIHYEEVQTLIKEKIEENLQRSQLSIEGDRLKATSDYDFGRILSSETLSDPLKEVVDRSLKVTFLFQKPVLLNGRLSKDSKTEDGSTLEVMRANAVFDKLAISYTEVLRSYAATIKLIAGNDIYTPQKVTLQGINLGLVAKRDVVIPEEGLELDISGINGKQFMHGQAYWYSETADKLKAGLSGVDGFDGLCGDNAGNIYIAAGREIKNLEQIKTIKCTGGAGANGQKGGKGQKGGIGENTGDAVAEDFGPCIFNPAFAIAFARIPGLDPNTEEFTRDQEKSGNGGNAGRAGFGGEGGYGGEILIKDSKNWIKGKEGQKFECSEAMTSVQMLVDTNSGNNGQDAELEGVEGGQAGEPGTYGCDHVIYVEGLFAGKKRKKGDYSNYLGEHPEVQKEQIKFDEVKYKRTYKPGDQSIIERPDLYAKRSTLYSLFSFGLGILGVLTFVAAVIFVPGAGVALGLTVIGLTGAGGFKLMTAIGDVFDIGLDPQLKNALKNRKQIRFDKRYCDDDPLRDEKQTRENQRIDQRSRGQKGEDSRRKEEQDKDDHGKSKERNNEFADELELANLHNKAATADQDTEKDEVIESLKQELGKKETEIKNNEAELKAVDQEVKEVSSKINMLNQQITAKETQKRDLSNKMQEIERIMQREKVEIGTQEAQLLENIDSYLKAVQAHLSKKIGVEFFEININGKEVLKQKLKEIAQHIEAAFTQDIQNIESEKKEIESKRDSMMKQKARIKQEIEALKNEELDSLRNKVKIAEIEAFQRKMREEKSREKVEERTEEVLLSRDYRNEKSKTRRLQEGNLEQEEPEVVQCAQQICVGKNRNNFYKRYGKKLDLKSPPHTEDQTVKKGKQESIALRETSLDSLLSYEVEGMDRLLQLRLEYIGIRNLVGIHPAMVVNFDFDKIKQVTQLQYIFISVVHTYKKIYEFIRSGQEDQSSYGNNVYISLVPLLLPETEYVYHWVGLIIEKSTTQSVRVSYLDSDNHPLIDMIDKQFLLEQNIDLIRVAVEQQRYNNCGPEVIENVVYYLTGTRAPQEAAIHVHSLLLENSLLNPTESVSTITANNQLIGLLSHQVPLLTGRMISSTALMTTASDSYDSSWQSSQGYSVFAFFYAFADKITNAFSSSIVSIGNAITSTILQNNYIKHKLGNYVYHEELLAINGVINKPYVQSSTIPAVQSLLQKHPLEWDRNDFKKMKLAVHPDKGGNSEDFQKVQLFEERIGDVQKMYQNLLPKLLPDIKIIIHKTNIGFKTLDTVVDGSRLVYEPTFYNAKKVIFDSSYLYSLYSGINGFGVILTGSEALYQIYNGEYMQAFQTVASSIAYMAFPTLLAYTAIPHIGLAYSISMATYTGYSAISNAYVFYLERTNDTESALRSAIAYRDLAQTLSNSPLQHIYDFETIAKNYETEVTDIIGNGNNFETESVEN